jgi:hypothetical protein
MKTPPWILSVLFVISACMIAVAQEYPKIEVPVGFSFVNVHPDLTPITSFNVFGGAVDLYITSPPFLESRPTSTATPKAVA